MATYTSTPGNDTFNGGGSDDVYEYDLGTGNDVITDTGGSDTILLGDPNNLYAGIWDAYRSGNNLVFDFNGPGTLTVTNQFLGAPVVEKLTFTDEPGTTYYFTNALVGGATNDVIVGTSAGESLDGAAGDDYIFANEGNDTILGGDGSDQIYAGLGDDSIDGGAGDDYVVGDAGNNTINGGLGFDEVGYEGSPSAIIANFSGVTQGTLANDRVSSGGDEDVTSGVEQIVGSGGNDVFYSGRTSGANDPNSLNNAGTISFVGMGGNDTFHIGGGANGAWGHTEYWSASQGVVVNLSNATINVGGNNVASMTARDGEGGIDTYVLQGNRFGIHGSDFADYIRGSDNYSNNDLAGNMGNDTIVGGALSDSVNMYTSDGATYGVIVNLSTSSITVTGGVTGDNGANVTVLAGQTRDGWGGADTLVSIESASGGNFNDYIVGSASAGVLNGNFGNDVLIGGVSDDALFGGAGADTLIGGAGNDVLNGGAITDNRNGSDWNSTSYASSTLAVNVNLATGTASDGLGGLDTLVNINLVRGSAQADTLTGSSANMWFELFEGGAGDDALDGGLITDTLNQENSNRVTYQNAGAAVTVDLKLGTATGTATGNDTLANFNQVRGSSYGDTLLGSDNAVLTERFEGRGGNDTIDGRGGFDMVAYDQSPNAVIVNLLTGTASDGFGGTDTLSNIEGIRGSANGDVLTGGLAANGVLVSDGLLEVFQGNGGNDTIDGGQGYDRVDYTSANSGVVVTLNDTLDGSASDGLGGTDVLRNIEAVRGSFFNDTLTGSNTAAFESFEGKQGSDVIDGKGGVDRADYRSSIASVTVNLGSGTALDGLGGTDTLIGIEDVRGSRDFGDSIIGSNADNKLEGLGGNDTLDGGVGNDILEGGDGSDFLFGGAGNDTLDGGVITDRINYSDGNTVSYTGATGPVTINLAGITGTGTTGSGTATGDASVGTDTLRNISYVRGSSNNDTITGSSALTLEVFEGGQGDDSIDGGAITDTLNGEGINRISYQNATGAVNVNLGTNSASGADGNDTLLNFNHVRGSSFADTLTGSNRTDLTEQFEGKGGNDTIDGAGGLDLVRYDNASGAVIVNLAAGTATGADGNDTLLNIEGARGSKFADLLTGGKVANDALEFFMGQDGNDTLDGGSGYDRADYNLSTAGVNVTLGGAGNGTASDGYGTTDTLISIEGVRGSAFNDTLTGSNDAGIYETFEGREGNDTLNGQGGTDQADYKTSKAGVTVNLATGTASDGFGGTDTLSNIEDVRGSRDFNDSITGSSANNKLDGLGGNDTLGGGLGTDTAVFSGAKSGYSITRNGSTYTVTDTNLADGNDGVDTLTSIELLQFSDGSRKLAVAAADFNGDGKSDILWRNNSTGADTLWLGGNNATTQSVATVSTAWKIAGNGDFNGDGKSDILWRNGSTGADAIWLSGNNATTQSVATVADLNWKVAGIGDFNGDSKDDILWRNTSTGGDTLWLGGNSASTQSVATVADQNWKIAGIGDFSGDGKDDILWRNASTGANTIWKNGSNASTQSVATVTDQNWKVAGIGDFDGDSKSDILWRNSSTGADTIWKGGNSATTQSVTTVADQNWKVTGIGDYNGDGKDDILWRNSSTGADTIWKGGSSASPQSVATVTDQNWQIPEQDSTWLTAGGAYPV